MGRLGGTIWMIMIRLQSEFFFPPAVGWSGVLTYSLFKAAGGCGGYTRVVLWCRGRCRRDVRGGSSPHGCTSINLNSFVGVVYRPTREDGRSNVWR
jgi:hypothetical protein